VIKWRDDHTASSFFKRTIAAQIHLLAAGFALACFLYLACITFPLSEKKHFIAALVYGLPAVLVFSASAVYHFLADGFTITPRLEKWLDRCDHVAIYLFIAGTYTPIIINAVEPEARVMLLIVIWTIAAVGVFYTMFKTRLPTWAQHRYFYTMLFIFMGWTLLLRAGDIVRNLPQGAMPLLIGGALSYSIGAVIFATNRPKLFIGTFGAHELWHVMVIAGFTFHYFMILKFYI
jgi:hemolysin III